jgi:transposase-like protein
MARREETTELVQVWQEAREAGEDPLRALMQVLLQGLLEEEMTAHLGAESRRAGNRRASGPSQQLQAAGPQDPRGEAGVVGAAGPPGAVPDGAV